MSNAALVLFSYKSHKYGYIEKLFKLLSDRANKHGVALKRSALKELHIKVDNGKLSVYDPINKMDLSQFAVVYLELWYKCPQQALAVAQYCNNRQIPYFSGELANMIPDTKVGEIAKLADTGVSVPDTLSTSNYEFKKLFSRQGLEQPFSYPFILKAADGYGGQKNYLIKDKNHLYKILRENRSTTFVAQEFIPNDCDFRCLVLGGEIKLIIQRVRQSNDTHLNNTSAGADGFVVDPNKLSDKAKSDVLKAAKVLGREQFAGVDLIVNSKTKQHYVLEVNQTPQIEIGVAVDQKMDALLEYIKHLGGERW